MQQLLKGNSQIFIIGLEKLKWPSFAKSLQKTIHYDCKIATYYHKVEQVVLLNYLLPKVVNDIT